MDDNFAARVAWALERQVEQVDEQVARNIAARTENIARHVADRDIDIAAAKRMNEELLARMDAALGKMDAMRSDLKALADRVVQLERHAWPAP